MMKLNIKIVVALLFVFSSGSAFANQGILDIQKSSVTFLNAKQPEKALSLLEAEKQKFGNNPQMWFLLAMAAKESNKPLDVTERYLRKVLSLDPNAGRVKLELAQNLYSQGKVDEAKKLLQEVKASKPPKAIGENIDSFLSRNTKKSQWDYSASAKFIYDTNANAGPEIDTVLFFGLPFQLSEDAKETSDSGLNLTANVNHIKPLTKKAAWQSSLSLSKADYQELDVLDLQSLVFATGPSIAVNKKLALSVPVVFDRIKVGHEKSYFYQSAGIAPQFRYAISDTVKANITLSASKREYKDRSDKDATKLSFRPSVGYKLSPKSYARVGLTIGEDDAEVDTNSNTLGALNVSHFYNLTDSLKSIVSVSHTNKAYEARQKAFREKREDETSVISLGLGFPVKSLDANFNLSHTKNESNLDLYTYDRTQVSLNLSKRF